MMQKSYIMRVLSTMWNTGRRQEQRQFNTERCVSTCASTCTSTSPSAVDSVHPHTTSPGRVLLLSSSLTMTMSGTPSVGVQVQDKKNRDINTRSRGKYSRDVHKGEGEVTGNAVEMTVLKTHPHL